jgi:hypothetical protein
VFETVAASDGRRTMVAKLAPFTADSFMEPTAECAIFQRYNARKKKWLDADPPVQLVRILLSREKRWAFPRVSGIITTPTLRSDGSVLSLPGYDLRSELYLVPGLQLPPIPDRPIRDQAVAALATLQGPFAEFSFKNPPIDRAVALSGLLTALLRGSLPTAPILLIRADTPGTGKSYLVDIIAMIATGRLCPVITASKSTDELEKRIGAVLLSGSSIISLDNVERDLEGELLCQLSERPIIRIRVLGHSEMPDKPIRYPPRSASWIEEMEKRSRRRTRDLVTQAASQGLSENEIGCARISMMARSTNAPCKGRIQMRKTNPLYLLTSRLHRTTSSKSSQVRCAAESGSKRELRSPQHLLQSLRSLAADWRL